MSYDFLDGVSRRESLHELRQGEVLGFGVGWLSKRADAFVVGVHGGQLDADGEIIHSGAAVAVGHGADARMVRHVVIFDQLDDFTLAANQVVRCDAVGAENLDNEIKVEAVGLNVLRCDALGVDAVFDLLGEQGLERRIEPVNRAGMMQDDDVDLPLLGVGAEAGILRQWIAGVYESFLDCQWLNESIGRGCR